MVLTVKGSLTLLLPLVGWLQHVGGHGRLIDPPSRASMWRYGFSTPHNYDDNQLFCGGVQNQWEVHGGKCGVCGDPWQGPREHEAGGKFANGIIVKQYEKGEIISVTVQLTANHKGWFEFRICKNNNPGKRITHECLDKNLLKLADGGTRFEVYGKVGYGVSEKFEIKLQLPQDLICTQCVLQWKYNAGNSWGTDEVTGQSGIGFGAQEQFYGCADISIGFSDVIKVGEVPKVYMCLLENDIEEGWYWGKAPPFEDDEHIVCGRSPATRMTLPSKTMLMVPATLLALRTLFHLN
ncbi:uncharacterized protein LOC135467415 [Liolophura sinensis]|uniref:uncharacterized protein LOC135467415 n=1 Tax=Liolophura sinensis TaxID=3198878 RepID=UPI0031587B75